VVSWKRFEREEGGGRRAKGSEGATPRARVMIDIHVDVKR